MLPGKGVEGDGDLSFKSLLALPASAAFEVMSY